MFQILLMIFQEGIKWVNSHFKCSKFKVLFNSCFRQKKHVNGKEGFQSQKIFYIFTLSEYLPRTILIRGLLQNDTENQYIFIYLFMSRNSVKNLISFLSLKWKEYYWISRKIEEIYQSTCSAAICGKIRQFKKKCLIEERLCGVRDYNTFIKTLLFITCIKNNILFFSSLNFVLELKFNII